MSAKSLILLAETAAIDEPRQVLRPEDKLQVMAFAELEWLNERGCDSVVSYREVLQAYAGAMSILQVRRERAAVEKQLTAEVLT